VGLGLTICQRLVEQFGGEIDYRSEYGVGSTFFFTIDVLTKTDKGSIKSVTKLSSRPEANSQIWIDEKISSQHLEHIIPNIQFHALHSVESEFHSAPES